MSNVADYNISLKCFLKNKKGEMLVLKTTLDSSFHWFYDFPWWRIDKDEFEVDYIDILKREILEETWIINVRIEKKVIAIWRHKVLASERKLSNDDNFLFYIFFEWFLECDDCTIVSDEHDDFKWIRLEEIVLEDYFISWYLEWAKMYLSR